MKDDHGLDARVGPSLPIDSREYGPGAQILRDIGVSSVRLLTRSPTKSTSVSDYGVTITERVALRIKPIDPLAAHRRPHQTTSKTPEMTEPGVNIQPQQGGQFSAAVDSFGGPINPNVVLGFWQ
jgi:hypothetical protein